MKNKSFAQCNYRQVIQISCMIMSHRHTPTTSNANFCSPHDSLFIVHMTGIPGSGSWTEDCMVNVFRGITLNIASAYILYLLIYICIAFTDTHGPAVNPGYLQEIRIDKCKILVVYIVEWSIDWHVLKGYFRTIYVLNQTCMNKHLSCPVSNRIVSARCDRCLFIIDFWTDSTVLRLQWRFPQHFIIFGVMSSTIFQLQC